MAFKQLEQADRRLVLLRQLADDADYCINSSILQKALEMYGHNISRDRLHTDIAWLAEQDLVTYEPLSSVLVVKITQRGLDAARGNSTVPGVARPGPGV